MSNCKVVIVGVGNSGTKILGILVNELLTKQGFPDYHYEPLYWSGTRGESGIILNRGAIAEHKRFPLIVDETIQEWKWMDNFLNNLNGLAKFIRAGSRVKLILKHSSVKVIWITRELYSYLGSMQKNFPRCLPNKGWHHRPGEYDDFPRLKTIYSDFDLRSEENYRIEVEAAWWDLHNQECAKFIRCDNFYHVRYEDLCCYPLENMKKIADFLEIPFIEPESLSTVHAVPDRNLQLSPRNIWMIEAIASRLNHSLYSLNQYQQQN